MNRKLLVAGAFVVAASLSSPANAQKHKDGDSCVIQAPDCDRTKNALWVCRPIVDPHKKPGDPQLYAWRSNGVCTNNLAAGEDMDKNAAKEKANGEARRKANEKREADEKAAEKKKADEKKAADDKKKADEKRAAEIGRAHV